MLAVPTPRFFRKPCAIAATPSPGSEGREVTSMKRVIILFAAAALAVTIGLGPSPGAAGSAVSRTVALCPPAC
jgi:hypothetical protein